MTKIENPLLFKASHTYNLAAEFFDTSQTAFWAHHGESAARRLQLREGETVLDVGCGTGASAIPAAELVGPQGHVTAIDIAEKMLHVGREKAAASGLQNIDFRKAGMEDSILPESSVDAIISVFSLFFVPDMETQLARLWGLLRPGGRIVVTVWADNAFLPVAPIFAEEVNRVRPDIPKAKRPWERLTSPENIRRLFIDAGAEVPSIEMEPLHQPIPDISDWWAVAKGSGFHWEIDQLSAKEVSEVQARTAARLIAEDVTSVEVSALQAIAYKQ